LKLIVFFGLIVLTLLSSLIFGRINLKNYKKQLTATIKAIMINLIILGLGSIWWFLTETDGISAGIGVMIYLGSMMVISLIDIVVIHFWVILEKKS
jgi:hypothetical protein